MKIILTILLVVIILFILFCFTNIKVYVEFDNIAKNNNLKLKVYLFSFLRVFKMKKEIKNENKKQSIKEKITMVINYLVKSKADPVDFAKKEVKKSSSIPDIVKRFDFSKIYLENLKLNVCLDLNNAAFSAIGTGIINSIISMVAAKYSKNIVGPFNYKVFPGYTGNGIKLETCAKIKVKGIEIIKVLFKKGGR